MAAAYVWGTEALLVTVGAGVVAVLIWRIRRGTEGYLRDASASVFLLGYISLMGGFAMLMLAAPDGPWRIVVFILLTIGNDIGGYATGVLFGRHPIAPQVSPKKSWEGFAGSLVVQCLIGVGAFIWVFDAPWWQGLIMGAVLTVTATAGDFVESAIKRDIGVKDMGSLLPGHGGIMDRLDSLVVNAFAAWALFALFLGQG
jgi:phosphatidate cytidylyltransferase